MTAQIEMGRLLRSSTTTFVVGCRVGQLDVPAFGALVRAPLGPDYQVYGLIYDIRIEDDGLVRQLVTAEHVSEEVILDNRERRIVPVEISVVVVGWEQSGVIHHQLPPRPPLSLDLIHLCDQADVARFTSAGRFGYLRHLLRMPELPLAELLAAHIGQARDSHPHPADWAGRAIQEVITIMRDDYALLTSVLSALEQVPHLGSHNELDRH